MPISSTYQVEVRVGITFILPLSEDVVDPLDELVQGILHPFAGRLHGQSISITASPFVRLLPMRVQSVSSEERERLFRVVITFPQAPASH